MFLLNIISNVFIKQFYKHIHNVSDFNCMVKQ